MKDEYVFPFREAVLYAMIDIYDNECKKVMNDAMIGKYDSFEFDEIAAMVFGVFLGELYSENRKKFLELTKPIYEEYCRMKSKDDAFWKREQIRRTNLKLVKNETT